MRKQTNDRVRVKSTGSLIKSTGWVLRSGQCEEHIIHVMWVWKGVGQVCNTAGTVWKKKSWVSVKKCRVTPLVFYKKFEVCLTNSAQNLVICPFMSFSNNFDSNYKFNVWLNHREQRIKKSGILWCPHNFTLIHGKAS